MVQYYRKEVIAMAPSEAQKKASNKYNAAHMATLGCKVKKSEAEAFRAYAEALGKTSNALLKEYVLDCINGKRKDDAPGVYILTDQ
jgi:hypothetical protein